MLRWCRHAREALEAAEADEAAATASLNAANALVAEVEAKVAKLQDQLQAAVDEKNEVMANADYLQKRAGLADRLI